MNTAVADIEPDGVGRIGGEEISPQKRYKAPPKGKWNGPPGTRQVGGRKGQVKPSPLLKFYRKVFSGDLDAEERKLPEVKLLESLKKDEPTKFLSNLKDLEKEHQANKHRVLANPALAAAETAARKPAAVNSDEQAAITLSVIGELIQEATAAIGMGERK